MPVTAGKAINYVADLLFQTGISADVANSLEGKALADLEFRHELQSCGINILKLGGAVVITVALSETGAGLVAGGVLTAIQWNKAKKVCTDWAEKQMGATAERSNQILQP